MKYRKLGSSDLEVSQICLGTMTWGEQNSEAEAHAQIECALEAGVNFIDAAEMYPVPGKAETQGRTEEILGTWLAQGQNRDKVLVATKCTGPSKPMHWIRGESNRVDRANLTAAIEGSLRRLQTDHIDLYQIHWPERVVNNFGRLNYKHDEQYFQQSTPILETLEVLAEFQSRGLIRHFGVSNETPWGLMQYLRHAELQGLPKIVSLQNPLSLLNRTLEIGISEVLYQENIGLMAYSTLAFGWLTGKYDGGQIPADSRLGLFPRFNMRYDKPQVFAAAERYNALAHSWGLSPAQMALAWVNQQDYVCSNIIGATTLGQLRENLASLNVVLSEEQCAQIDALQAELGSPAP